ncbi:hypothetical protein EJB05_37415, partial [Eragrostis curvula]
MTTTARPEKRRRRNAETPAAASIPDDVLISHVFWRLPVDSLMRVKFVCRSWRAAIEDPSFIRRHLELSHARGPPSFLVVPRAEDADNASVSEDVSFHRLLLDAARAPETANVELVFETAVSDMTNAIRPTHCDGLVALATATEKVFVCNPATREFVALPPGTRDARPIKDRAPAAALGYDASRDRYVVARYFYREYREFKDAGGKRWLDFDIGHEVFTLGGDGDGSWELTDDPPHAIAAARPICTRDAFYWCTDHLGPNVLLRFGLRDRAFDVVPFPPGVHFDVDHSKDHVTELSGKLCYAHPATKTAFDVWIAHDDGPRLEWSLRCRVDFDDYGGGVSSCQVDQEDDFDDSDDDYGTDDSDIGSQALLPVTAAGDEILIAADHSKLYSYDAMHRSVRKVVDMEKELAYARPDGSLYYDGLVHHVVPYVESLVPIGNKKMQIPLTRLRNARTC